MKIAIHQPHYFPWLGYFDKMKKVDKFVLLDQVQFEKGSQMIRNRVLDNNGFIKYLTISADTKNYLSKPYNDISTKDNEIWTVRQLNALENYYKKADYYGEVFPIIQDFLSTDFKTVCECTIGSIQLVCELLEIKTSIVYQSDVSYNRDMKKSDLVFSICDSLGADVYYSGKGASVNYLNRDCFAEHNINIVFQEFKHPEYGQINSQKFVAGLSILDVLFNCGINGAKAFLGDLYDTGAMI